MTLFSNTQWYHFASMVISVALLGFGASGTFLTIFRSFLLDNSRRVITLSMLACSLFMALSVTLSQLDPIRFDSFLIFSEQQHVFKLIATYLVLFIPFFFGGLAIGVSFARDVKNIGTLYFANLLGSGIGGILVLGLFWHFYPASLPIVIAILPLIAALIFIMRKLDTFIMIPIIFVAIVILVLFINPPETKTSEFKSISQVLQLPDAEIKHEQPTPFGLIQVVSAPALRYAPGLSLQYRGDIPIEDVVFSDGEWFGPIIFLQDSNSAHIYDYSTIGLPYRMNAHQNVLVLDAGTGDNIAHALSNRIPNISAIEPNATIPRILNSKYPQSSVYLREEVSLHQMHNYTYLLSAEDKYDLIVMPTLDAFGGTSGLYALQERYYLTLEAFEQMWDLVDEDGMICISTWMDYPVRYPLRILSTFTELLDRQNISDYQSHIAAIRSWGMVSFVLKKTPLTDSDVTSIRNFASEMNFDPLQLPDIQPEERTQYNQMEDESFFTYFDLLMSGQGDDFIRDYEFNIAPTSENRPYFSQFIRLDKLSQLRTYFSDHSLPFLELGYIIILVTLLQVSIVAIILIILPLLTRRWGGSHKIWTLFYFGALGIGFMFIEIVFIQRFVLYFGNPIYAATAVISSILIFSGLGSFTTSYFIAARKSIMNVCFIIITFAILYSIFLTPILKLTINTPILIKLLLTIILIGPISFAMGMPFPFGLRLLNRHNPTNICWAWGINGCLSVISAVLATVIAVEFGFIAVMIIAALMYAIAHISTSLSYSKF
jgi:spermidine synthase